MEKFGQYNFRIITNISLPWGYFYEILDDSERIIRTAKEVYQYEGIARFAAIGHIALLEQGIG